MTVSPARPLGLDVDAAFDSFRRVDRDAHGWVVEAGAGRRLELPTVPRAAQHAPAAEVVSTRSSRLARAHDTEAERAAVVRAAVAHATELAVDFEHADLTSSDASEQAARSLKVGEGADVVPLAHA